MVSGLARVFSSALGDAVWRATELGRASGATLVSGHAALDAELPVGGWPVGAISEILQAHGEHHEWRLLLPALRRAVDGAPATDPVVLVGAPRVPFGPGLTAQGLDAKRLLWVLASATGERLWAAEQALHCARAAAVLVWLPQVRCEPLRRLQMGAQTHGKLLFVMRPWQAAAESSPAALRVLVSTHPGSDALQLQILKRRGPPQETALSLPARPARIAALLASCAAQQRCDADGGGQFFQESGDALAGIASAA